MGRVGIETITVLLARGVGDGDDDDDDGMWAEKKREGE
jgi:hypothetical protein